MKELRGQCRGRRGETEQPKGRVGARKMKKEAGETYTGSGAAAGELAEQGIGTR